ncbi:MAG: hypothetical protein ABIN25_11045 [Ginsengibacter sp.]
MTVGASWFICVVIGVLIVKVWNLHREVVAMRGQIRAHRDTLRSVLAWARDQGATVNFKDRS